MSEIDAIKFFDIEAQYQSIKSAVDARISNVLKHSKYILGPEVYELEEALCAYTGSNYCITCGNGTDALHVALLSLGIGNGDEVITPAFSYIAAAEAISLTGATPIFVDIDENTFNIDIDMISDKITTATKAIIAVSLYGQCPNFQQINMIAKEHEIKVIEDAAQSFGSCQNGKKSCNLTDISCTSFFPTKPLGCYGDGGAIFTNDEELALRIRKISRHGQSQKYEHEVIGLNSRLDTLQAAVLLEKLKILDLEINRRDEIAKKYNKIRNANIVLPNIDNINNSAWAQFTLRVDNRNKFLNYLTDNGIPSFIHYPKSVTEQKPFYQKWPAMPTSERMAKEVVSIPVHAYLTEHSVNYICEVLRQYK